MPESQPPIEYAAIELRLSRAERELLARSAPPLEEDLRRKLKVDVTENRDAVVSLGHEDAVRFSAHLEAVAARAARRRDRIFAEALHYRLEDVLTAGRLASLATPPPAALPTIDIDRIMQTARSWEEPGSPIVLNSALDITDLRGVPMFEDARRFLGAVLESGAVEATAEGDLSDEFVARVGGTLRLGPSLPGPPVTRAGGTAELDVWPLHVLRMLLQGVRLVGRRKGQFSVTKRGRELLADERAGELYKELFRSYYQRMNWNYIRDRFADRETRETVKSFQNTIGMCLWALPQCARNWVDLVVVAGTYLPPLLSEGLVVPARGVDPWELLSMFVAEALSDFGLVEVRRPRAAVPDKATLVRVTGLYDRFLTFGL